MLALVKKNNNNMRMALGWLLPSHAAPAICTDSQSLLKAIQSSLADTADLGRMLNKRADKTTLLCIPGHHGITGNEVRMPVLSKRQQLPMVLPDHSPSPRQFAFSFKQLGAKVPKQT